VGVDVGGTNTDAVIMAGRDVVAWLKSPTTDNVSAGVAAAIGGVLQQAGLGADAVASVMIGTTHFTNALVERKHLVPVGVLRLASPSGEALPPMTGWPAALAQTIGEHIYLLPGGYEVDGREISPLDEGMVRAAARALRQADAPAIAITCAFAPINAAMEERAAAIVREEYPDAAITVSHAIGRIGFIERENATILNAALSGLAARVMASFEAGVRGLGIAAPIYVSQNDGTLISAAQAAAYPILTIGSGPTNSMRGAAFLTGVSDAIVVDVGGTTTDIGVLVNGFPRESSVAVDIGGVRTNFRMPDILAIGLGGGTRIHLDAELYQASQPLDRELRVGPDSVGYRLTEDAWLFGGTTLTASDVAVAAGLASFGAVDKVPALSERTREAVLTRMRELLEDGVDRMKTSREGAIILAVGGGNFLIPDELRGAASVVRPAYAAIANAVGAAIAQVGAQIELVVNYDSVPRAQTLERLRQDVTARAIAAGGDPDSVAIVEIDEVYLSYLPGRAAQVRIKAVADLAQIAGSNKAIAEGTGAD
jgi:N-methylhydantoinase A/oxoprolinase/acetone carboxylase beta subunit